MSRLPNVRRRQPSKAKQALAALSVLRLVLSSRRAAALAPLALAAVAVAGLRKRKAATSDASPYVPPAAPQSYRSTPTPASAQTTGGGAAGPDPAGPTATEQAKELKQSATPPHGDPLLDDAEQAPPVPAAGDDLDAPNESAITTELAEEESKQA